MTRALISASQAPKNDLQTRAEALDWNRRMWSALAIDCGAPENQLSQELRAQIISLSMWVSRYSSAVLRNEETFDALIDVNRTVMQGLAQRTAA